MTSTAAVDRHASVSGTASSGTDARPDVAARAPVAGVARAMAPVAASASQHHYLELACGTSVTGVPYVVGGWSTEARRALAVHAADFSVTLVFAHRGSCEYIADVNVRVADDHGVEVVALDEAGPIVLFDLMPGSYQVTVSRNGQALARTITVGPRTRRQTVFYWSGSTRAAERSGSVIPGA